MTKQRSEKQSENMMKHKSGWAHVFSGYYQFILLFSGKCLFLVDHFISDRESQIVFSVKCSCLLSSSCVFFSLNYDAVWN